jgi:hypothetical protein
MSNATTKSTIGTHRSEIPIFLGWKYVFLITHKCLAKLASTSSYSQYCEYTTPMLSITPWVGNLCSKSFTRQSTTSTIQKNPNIHFPKSNACDYEHWKCNKSCKNRKGQGEKYYLHNLLSIVL